MGGDGHTHHYATRSSLSSIVDDPRVLKFADDARAYCDFIDHLSDGKPPTLYSQLLTLLSNLAASGLAIPFDMPDRDVTDDLDLTSDELTAISCAITEAVFAETSALAERYVEEDTELTRAVMFWDDLSSVYSDIKHGLRLFDAGTPDCQSEAIWQWRFGYENHWGTHLMRALATVHEIRFFIHAE